MGALGRTGWLVVAAAWLAGAGIRLAAYAHCRPLWLDEAMLALNVAGRSFADLLKTLDYIQVAPVLYLWLQRALFLAGVAAEVRPEWALRASALAGGLAVLALLPYVARKLAGEAAMVAAAVMAALSPALVRFSNEAKPYGTDPVIGVVLLAAALWLREAPETRRRWWLFGVAGALGVLASFPALFVAGSAALFALVDGRLRVHRVKVLVCGAAWAVVFLASYLGVYRTTATHVHQQTAYGEALLAPGPDWWGRAQFAVPGSILPAFFGNGSHTPAVSTRVADVVYLVVAAGVVVVAVRGGAAALLIAGPLVLAVAASLLGRYPVGVPRMMVFAAPLLLLAAAAALGAVVERLRWRLLRDGLSMALIAAVMGRDTWQALRVPFEGEDSRTLIAVYMKRRRMDEPVYVSNHGLPSWLFYTTNWREPNRERLAFYAKAAGPDGPAFDNAPSRGRMVQPEDARDLAFPYRRRVELLGLAPGRQWLWRRGFATPEADPGWAAVEARRIFDAAQPCAWLYATRLSDRTFKPITWHLRDAHRGFRQIDERVPGGLLMRWCFPPR